MPSHDSRAIANEFLRHNSGTMSQVRLQKLVYLAHGWNLAVNGQPLVEDQMEAWDGGPVIRSIWNYYRGLGIDVQPFVMKDSSGVPFQANLSGSERQVMDRVEERYGRYSGQELSRMTHQPGTPWSNAYFGRGRNALLRNEDIRQHFVRLALAGRRAHTA